MKFQYQRYHSTYTFDVDGEWHFILRPSYYNQMTYIEYLFQPALTKGFAHLQTQGALCNLFSFVRCMRPFQRKRLYKMYTLKPLGNPNNHWNIARLLPVNIIKPLFNGYMLFWTNRQPVLCTLESMICLWYVYDLVVQAHRMLHLKSCVCICIRFCMDLQFTQTMGNFEAFEHQGFFCPLLNMEPGKI